MRLAPHSLFVTTEWNRRRNTAPKLKRVIEVFRFSFFRKRALKPNSFLQPYNVEGMICQTTR